MTSVNIDTYEMRTGFSRNGSFTEWLFRSFVSVFGDPKACVPRGDTGGGGERGGRGGSGLWIQDDNVKVDNTTRFELELSKYQGGSR